MDKSVRKNETGKPREEPDDIRDKQDEEYTREHFDRAPSAR